MDFKTDPHLRSYLKIAHVPTVLKNMDGFPLPRPSDCYYPGLRIATTPAFGLLRFASQSSAGAVKLAAVNGLAASQFYVINLN
jgi:hypothetical protein